MTNDEAPQFHQILETLFATYGKKLDKSVAKAWWAACSDLTMEAFSAAASAYLRTAERPPVPAHIRDLAGANRSEWPTPEEAWNGIPKDERDAGWMCHEMATAMGACWDSLEAGDRIGARMAFIEVYKREIHGKRGRPKWWISEAILGHVESRLYQKLGLLEQHPERIPSLLPKVRAQLEALTGSERQGGGLRLASDMGKRMALK